jgi:hypothetical protein
MVSSFPQNIHAMRSFSEMVTSQITADHLPKYNLGFFFYGVRNEHFFQIFFQKLITKFDLKTN